MIKFPYTTMAFEVQQPIGVYYVAVLPAELLLQVAFSDALSARYVEGSQSYVLDGTQREPQLKRLEPIANYIDRIDAAFPNAIILAANYRKEDGRLEDAAEEEAEEDAEEKKVEGDGSPPSTALRSGSGTATSKPIDRRWFVTDLQTGPTAGAEAGAEVNRNFHILTIPTKDKLAGIIDGQHRLFAFTRARDERRSMPLICSIFLDLPKPYQAQLFATINSTQKPVDRSLTYELFGYNVVDEPENQWSPDKLAVFLTRRLNTEQDSPLRGRVAIAPKKDEVLAELGSDKSWKVSTAVVVDGIMRLFTANPKSDSANLLKEPKKTRDSLGAERKDKSPLRSAYLGSNDVLIYTMVLNYLRACQTIFWENAPSGSYITKTIGVQALFDILRMKLASSAFEAKTISVQHFTNKLAAAGRIDYTDGRFRNLSGAGRTFIRKEIETAADL